MGLPEVRLMMSSVVCYVFLSKLLWECEFLVAMHFHVQSFLSLIR